MKLNFLNQSRIQLIIILCIVLLTCAKSSAQVSDSSKTHMMLSIGYTPSYDKFNPFSLSFHLNSKSLKEYQLMLAVGLTSKLQYYRTEAGVNWYLTERNRQRRLMVFPSTSIAYIYKYRETYFINLAKEKFEITEHTAEAFVLAGFNSKFRLNRFISIVEETYSIEERELELLFFLFN